MLPQELLEEEGIEEAIQAMRFANSNPTILDLIKAREKQAHKQDKLNEEAEKEGLKQGLDEGKKERIQIVLKLMKITNMTDQEISNAVDIDIQKIINLRNTISSNTI